MPWTQFRCARTGWGLPHDHSTDFVETPAAKAAYDARWQRIMDCVNLKQPDRMPVTMFATFWLAKYGGITNRQLMYDHEKVKEIGERAILEFEPDTHDPLVLQCRGPFARSGRL